jgi:thimet oligopeptidase
MLKLMRIPSMILALVVLLTACGADEQSTPEPVPVVESPSLEADYRMVEVAALQTAEQFNAACDTEVEAVKAGIKSLESAGEGTGTGDYLEFLNSQFVSRENMAARSEMLAAVHPDVAVRDAADACGQALTAVFSDLMLSRPIYDALSAMDISAYDASTQRFVEKLLLDFRLSGVDKDEETRARIKELNDLIVTIGQEFDRNIADDVRYLELDSIDSLAGLPEDYIASHQPDDDGIIRISTQYPDLFPLLEYAESDTVRRDMLMLYLNRAYPQNEELLRQLLARRFELAGLLGFENYAQFITADKMVGSPERVETFLEELKTYTAEAQDRDYDMLLTRLRQDQPDADRVERWQSNYLRGKVRLEQFDVDSKVVREYFNYTATREGILTLVQDLFGVQFKPWDTETWHEEVEAYELWDDGKLIGNFYLDMHPREGKYGHAAAFTMHNGITDIQLPAASLVCNFPRGDELMQHGQVVTFLHEFGHLMHVLFAGGHHWSNISGIKTEWDFVEAPSQMLQEWVWDYETIQPFARNAAGEPLPRDLLERMTAARDFGLGMGTRRQLGLAALSLGLYNRDPEGLDIKAFSDDIEGQFIRFEPLEGAHFYASFPHLNSYSAIYYTYQWSLAIATDLFTRFQQEGLRNVETAGEYRDMILGQGGAKPAAELVTEFLGREVSFKPYADRLSGAGRVEATDGE